MKYLFSRDGHSVNFVAREVFDFFFFHVNVICRLNLRFKVIFLD